MSEEPGRSIERRDEVLELLYWLEGERLRGAANLEAMTRFLSHPQEEVATTLAELVTRGQVRTTGDGEYRLTEDGRHDAARRFGEDFASLLSQGHGECNDPDCECHTSPEGAAACHARTGSPRPTPSDT